MLELVSARPPFERAERDASAGQRRDVAVIVPAERFHFVLPRNDGHRRHVVRRLARRAVELVRGPVVAVSRSLVDGKTFRPARVKL